MKAMVGLVFAVLIIFGLRLFWPSSEFEVSDVSRSDINIKAEAESSVAVSDETNSSSAELNAPDGEEKTKLMKAEYEILEQARKNLKHRLALLKHEMWGLKFPSTVAKEISTSVMSASKLLKNPGLLGAFLNVEQIKDEIAKVNFAKKSLEEVNEIIKVKIQEDASSEGQTNSTRQ